MTKAKETALLGAIVLAMTTHFAYGAKVLQGTYRVAIADSCQSNDYGFTDYPELLSLYPSYQVRNTQEGTMEFRNDGSVTHVASGQYALPELTSQPVGTFEHVCQYASTANADGSFDLVGSCDANVLSGIGVGETAHVSPIHFKVFENAGVILISNTGVEVITLSTNVPGTHYRICQSQGMGIKAK